MTRIRVLVRKAADLTLREWRDLLRAERFLVWAQLAAWLRPRGTLIQRAAHTATPPPIDRVAVRRWSLAIDRAATYGPLRPLCLVRAMALQRLLNARGIHGCDVQVGVRWQAGRFAAHAWVVYGEEIVSDHEWHVKGFRELVRLSEKAST